MKENLTWLKRECNKDEIELVNIKNKTIKDILQTPKEYITRGSVKLKKESIWKRILKKLKHL